MAIKVKFFASVRDEVGAGEIDVQPAPGTRVRDVWAGATGRPLDPHVLVAINQSYASQDDPVADGDEVAFFPPVTGG